MLRRMSVDSHRQRIGIMFACLDGRRHRPRSGAQHPGAPDVNLPASIRCTGIPGRHSRRTRNPVSHSRRADSLDGAPLGAPQNQGGAERLENVGNPPEAVSRVAVSPPGCGAAGERQDTGGNCGNWRNGPAGCCPQPWIPVGGDQRSGLQCFFVQWFQRLGVAQAIILRAGARCHRTVTSS